MEKHPIDKTGVFTQYTFQGGNKNAQQKQQHWGNDYTPGKDRSREKRKMANIGEPKRWIRYSMRGKQLIQSECASGAAMTENVLQYRMNIGEITQLFSRYAINNTVMITICDKGYLDVFKKFYHLNNMGQYKNFVAVVLDKAGYDVC